jgi:DNA-binding winged helix-turn-helix (wHTH) protein
MQDRRFFSFGPYCLDMHNEQLWHAQELIRLTHKALAVLGYLAEHRGQLATKGELFEALWPGVVVSDSSLIACVSELRRALGDARRTPHYIETVHGRGYRFIAPVYEVALPRHHLDSAVLPAPSVLTPYVVGREAELAYLGRLFENALQGERQIVFVTGEAGIGKTTLVNRFLGQMPTDGGLWSARGQCVKHYGVAEPYLPLLDALGRLCRGTDGELFIDLLRRHAPTWLMQMPALLSTDARKALSHRVAEATQAPMLRELTEALEVLTRDRALVLVLEDLLWSDDATVEWLGAVARRQEPAKLLLIGTYRPVEVMVQAHPLRHLKQELHLHGLCEELPLSYLTEDAIADYLKYRVCFEPQGQTLRQGLARLVHQRTEGNPLFMVNVVKDWARQGVLVEEAGQWVLRGRLDEIAVSVPDTLRQLIEQQLEQLDLEVQALLETASVAGVRFTAAMVAAGMDAAVEVIEAHCDALVRREQFVRACSTAVWPGWTTVARFEFRHALYQEVLYHRVSITRRMRLHQQMGERLTQGESWQT